MSNSPDVIIIGAGACGLMAAKELSDKGKKVMVLEAKPFAGGRIHTISSEPFLQPVETGAEFIHGNLPVTLGLLKKANISYTKTEGEMLRNSSGKWHETDEQVEGWDELMTKMEKLEEDTTLSFFLNAYFDDKKHNELRQQALQYAQGFDAVDPDKASVFALRDEWEHEEEATYRVDGGYGRLVHYLLEYCEANGCSVVFGNAAIAVDWKQGNVMITTDSGEKYEATQVLVTVPAGVLRLDNGAEGCIQFSPALPQIQQAVKEIGYGNVIKILLQFSSLFWLEQEDALFFFSDQKIATWWTQSPSPYPMLTGWIAGKKADDFMDNTEREILQMSLQSLANIFNKTEQELQALLTASHIVNWEKDNYTKGAYSYSMVGSEDAKKILNEPIENTVFFAGEALYSGKSGGTVEAALVQGLEVAKKILKGYEIGY